MRFLLDQNLPVSLIAVLAELGHEAFHIKTLDLAEADDRAVWNQAAMLDAVMVSKDSDVVVMAGRGGRLVRLRVGNRSNNDLFTIIASAWPEVVQRLTEGETLVDVHG